MDVKEAVRRRKITLLNFSLMKRSQISALKKLSSTTRQITGKYHRLFPTVAKTSLATALGNQPPGRSYKLVCINDDDGHVNRSRTAS